MQKRKITIKTQQWNAKQYHQHAHFVSSLALPMIELLNPKKGEKILDLGCGDGTLAVEIEKYHTYVTAIDSSEDMVNKAKEKGIDAHLISATEMTHHHEFDALFSNATLHWVKDADLSIKRIYQALKKQGRFVAEFGGYGNIKHLTDAMQEVFNSDARYGEFINPWYFPKPKEYQLLLEKHGFEVNEIELIPRPTPIDDISHWLDIFANGIVSHLSIKDQQSFKEKVGEILKLKLYSEKDGWVVDYVRLRLKATKN